MAHLFIHGIPIECSASEWEPVRMGEITRSLNGMPRSSVRVKKGDYRFTTDVGGMALPEAEVVRALIEGEGHCWSFDVEALYSSRGLMPSYVSATDIQPAGVEGLFDEALIAEAGSLVQWPLGFTGGYTLMYWRLEGGTWVHYLIRALALGGDKAVWRNDDKTDSDPGILTIGTDGKLSLTCADEEAVDDLVALPYPVLDAWVNTLWEDRTLQPWAALPFVRASGPGVPDTGLTAIALAGPGRRVPLRDENGTFTTGEVFDFTLQGT